MLQYSNHAYVPSRLRPQELSSPVVINSLSNWPDEHCAMFSSSSAVMRPELSHAAKMSRTCCSPSDRVKPGTCTAKRVGCSQPAATCHHICPGIHVASKPLLAPGHLHLCMYIPSSPMSSLVLLVVSPTMLMPPYISSIHAPAVWYERSSKILCMHDICTHLTVHVRGSKHARVGEARMCLSSGV